MVCNPLQISFIAPEVRPDIVTAAASMFPYALIGGDVVAESDVICGQRLGRNLAECVAVMVVRRDSPSRRRAVHPKL